MPLTPAGADVFVLAAGGRGRAARRGDGEHRGGGVLRRRQVRGLPQGNAQHGLPDTQEKHTTVNRKLQGEGNRGSSRAYAFAIMVIKFKNIYSFCVTYFLHFIIFSTKWNYCQQYEVWSTWGTNYTLVWEQRTSTQNMESG